jgi:S-adenosyl-L-methionine hydrolase (adenosine-forming)
MRILALLTDFGLEDPYAAQVKAVLATRAPRIPCIDISHGVRPHNILQAGFFLSASRAHFPAGTLFLSVIDPGVGTERAIVLLEQHDQLFLAPDNGLLTMLLEAEVPARSWLIDPASMADVQASTTFHGRDLFAPLAARLVMGEEPFRIGRPHPPEQLVRLELAVPRVEGQRLVCSVLHVDRFGNAILSLAIEPWRDLLFSLPGLILLSGNRRIVPAATYAKIPGRDIGLLPGSQGHLELALRQRSAAALLGLDIGSEVVLLLRDDPVPGRRVNHVADPS